MVIVHPPLPLVQFKQVRFDRKLVLSICDNREKERMTELSVYGKEDKLRGREVGRERETAEARRMKNVAPFLVTDTNGLPCLTAKEKTHISRKREDMGKRGDCEQQGCE